MMQRLLFKVLCLAVFIAVVPQAVAKPYPLEYFALREVTSNVTVSPDGERLAMLRILGKTGNPILHIYDTDDLDGDPFVVGSEKMEIRSYFWASDDHVVMTFRQKVRDKIEGQNQGVYETRIAILDIEEEEFKDFDAAFPQVENLLPFKKNRVIISEQPGMEDFGIREAFRPRAYYEMDLKRGTKKLLIRGKIDVAQIAFDPKGNPRFARGYDAPKQEYVWYYRPPGGKGWTDIHRISADTFEYWFFDIMGIDEAVPGNLLVRANNGHDKQGLWSFNPKTRTFDELIYRRSDVDVYGVRFHSNDWTNPDSIVAVRYYKDNMYSEFFDEVEGATYAQLEGLIPYAFNVVITSRSRDGDTLTVRNQGPRDPGTYYLLRNGEFKEVGSQQPLLDPAELADVEYITYEARDGREIPAFVTKPNTGEAPYPLVVMPHGGPHVLEVVMFDEWAQVLANNGYMVLQPQYRMSHGYGMDHFTSAFINGSEWGRKMQDDKDDGALYLVEQGLADKDRIAMYGWSYGGYAALVAASRTPQIYQCVIAGAAVSNPRRQINEYGGGYSSETDRIWVQSNYDAVQPTEEVDKVNVPILLIHGDVDQRVRPRQAKMYVSALEKANKPYEMVWLEGADHFYSTLFFEHQLKLYETLISYLANDCGPGGL